MDILKTLLLDKIKNSNISVREASRQIGVTATTIGRALEGETVDVDTLIRICKWLNVSPSYVLDSELPQPSSLGSRMAALIEAEPRLAEVFGEAIEYVVDGKADPRFIRDIASYAAYRINLAQKEDKENIEKEMKE